MSGFICAVWGVFLLASSSTPSMLVLYLVSFGSVDMVMGLFTFSLARKQRWWLLPTGTLVAAVAVVGLHVAALLSLSSAEQMRLVSVVVAAGSFALPLLATITLHAVLLHAKATLAEQINKEMALQAKVVKLQSQSNALVAARKLQSIVRGYRDRKLVIRHREMVAWTALSTQRRVMVAVAYIGLFVVIGFGAYINLLFGVKFTPSQSRAWIVASLTAFVTDAVVNQPLSLLGRVVIQFVRKVLKSSLDSVLVSRISAKVANDGGGGRDASAFASVFTDMD
jgi:hypothetical protein